MSLRFLTTTGTILLLIASLMGCQRIDQGDLGSNSRPSAEIAPKLADPATLRSLERELYQGINQYRRSRQLPPLNLNPTISQQARLHSKQMAANMVEFGENNLKQQVEDLSIALKIEKAAQTIAINGGHSNPTFHTLQGWIDNNNQRQHLEGDYDLTGIGIAQNSSGEYYITQIFIKESPDLLTQSPQWDTSLERWKNNNPLLNRQENNNPALDRQKINKPSNANSPINRQNTNQADSSNFNLLKIEAEINRQVNQYRLSKNLPALKMDARISQIARLYSQKMASKQATFSHDGFDQRVKAMGVAIPLKSAAENLAYLKGYPDLATTAVEGWIDSPGHQKNMVGNFNVTGIGIAKNADGEYYFTQLFLLER